MNQTFDNVNWSVEHRRKQSLGLQYKQKLRKRKTPSERRIEDLLTELNIKFQDQKVLIAGDFFCIADFYLPKPYRLVIEVDGGYHQTETQKWRDFYKDRYYESRKFKVLRLTDTEALAVPASQLHQKIRLACGK